MIQSKTLDGPGGLAVLHKLYVFVFQVYDKVLLQKTFFGCTAGQLSAGLFFYGLAQLLLLRREREKKLREKAFSR